MSEITVCCDNVTYRGTAFRKPVLGETLMGADGKIYVADEAATQWNHLIVAAVVPRFSVMNSRRAIGVIDSHRPGKIIPTSISSAAQLAANLNATGEASDNGLWVDIPPEWAPWTRETMPDEVRYIRGKGGEAAITIGQVYDGGVFVAGSLHKWGVLLETAEWSTSHKRSATWNVCGTNLEDE